MSGETVCELKVSPVVPLQRLVSRTHPLGNIVEFHEHSLNPNDLDLAWRKHMNVSIVVHSLSKDFCLSGDHVMKFSMFFA